MVQDVFPPQELSDKEIEAAIQRLGWLSSYTRQILLCRALLRSLYALDSLPEVDPLFRKDQELLKVLRHCISIQSISREQTQAHSIYAAPYEPADRPITFFLSKARSLRFFEVTIDGLPAAFVRYSQRPHLGAVDLNGMLEEIEFQKLASEIRSVAKSVTMTTKFIGDARAEELRSVPLWKGVAIKIDRSLLTLESANLATRGAFAFWIKWYKSLLLGNPMDWELQLRVSAIPDLVWNAGANAVAKEIAQIEAEYLSEKIPQAEEITFNENTGKFSVAPIPVENAPLMAALMARISDEFEDALSGHNGLSETSGDGRRIKRATTRYANNPQQAELTLTTVAKSLRRQMHETSELPDSPDNLALLEAVEDGVRGIRANHPEVEANREQLAQQALREITPEDREMLEKAAPELTAISEGDLAKDFADDIPELINDAVLPLPSGAPPLPGADASTRLFSRLSKMALMAEKVEKGLAKGAQAFDSDLAKTIRLAGLGIGVAGGVTAFLYQLVQIGLRLFGVI